MIVNHLRAILCVCLTLIASEALAKESVPPPTPLPQAVSATLHPFHAVVIDGPYDVFFTQDASYHLTATGSTTTIAHSTAQVEEGVLVIKLDPAYQRDTAPASVTIYAPMLINFSIARANHVNLENIAGTNFHLNARAGEINVLNAFGDKANYTLAGQATLHGTCINTNQVTLQATEHSQVHLTCLDNQQLTIKGRDFASIDVAGQARKLSVTLLDHATLNSREIIAGSATLNSDQQTQTSIAHVNVGSLKINSTGQAQTSLRGAITKLYVSLKQNAMLNLGKTRVNTLTTETAGASLIEMRHLKFNHYILTASGNSYVLISGKAQRLDATMLDHAKLNSLCLEARTLFIETANEADARVRNYHGLSAFAKAHSTIFYYEDPKMVAAYLRASGSVLRMPGLGLPPLRC